MSGPWRSWGQAGRTPSLSGTSFLTDVWGARRTGLYSILTKPMDPHEEIQIVFKRYLEAVVLRAYKKQRQKPDV